tara:strand:- start:52 stop:456 length:405 start_codon:yes stop_codon:yes gene_type:complete
MKQNIKNTKDRIVSSHDILGRWQSGQMHQTVNLAAEAFGGSNPSLPTRNNFMQSERPLNNNYAVVAQLVEHQPSKLRVASSNLVRRSNNIESEHRQNYLGTAYVAQSVEHVLGKDGVTGSNPVVGSLFNQMKGV